MRVKTLADVKREMANKRLFYICDHRIPDYIGQIREPNVIQTNGVYTKVFNEPEDKVSLANGGKGSWFAYGKAKNWVIDESTGHCYLYSICKDAEYLVMEFVFFDDATMDLLMKEVTDAGTSASRN